MAIEKQPVTSCQYINMYTIYSGYGAVRYVETDVA